MTDDSRMRPARLIFAISLLYAVAARADTGSFWLGVLEEMRDRTDDPYLQVRVLFERGPDGWHALPHEVNVEGDLERQRREFPRHVQWNSCVEGELSDVMSSELPSKWETYGDVGVHLVDEVPRALQTGARSVDFGGWPGGEVRRPIVLTTGADCSDPAHWQAIAAKKVKLPPAPKGGYVLFDKTLAARNPLKTTDKIARAFRSVGGDLLVELQECDRASEACRRLTLVKLHKQAWRLLNVPQVDAEKNITDVPELLFVDAADFDADGTAELLFKVQGYNQDGYRLYTHDLVPLVTFDWSYH